MKKIFDVLNIIKQKLFVKKDKIHSEKYYRRIDFLNKYSLSSITNFFSFDTCSSATILAFRESPLRIASSICSCSLGIFSYLEKSS